MTGKDKYVSCFIVSCSYLNCVRVVQPQVVEPHGEATAGGVEDPHGALLRQTMC